MGWYRFGDFELDLDSFVLRRGGEVLPMQPKVFDVLRHLVERRGKLVTKADLLTNVWGDGAVSDGVITWSVSHIRRTLGQQGGRHPIETVQGRGYRFTGEVRQGEGSAPPVPSVDRSETMPRTSSALVGRASVMAELERRIRDAREGRGSLCVITGEAGIGKTRCADEGAMLARELGMHVLPGRCPQEPAPPTLWPIATALREVPDIGAQARRLIAEVDVGGLPDDERRSGARFRLIEQVSTLLLEVASARPTLLIVDDLQCADVGSLGLLGFIAPELRSVPLCIVATLRDGESQPVSSRDEALRRVLRHAHTIPLDTLDTAQVAELAQHIGEHRPNAELAEALRRATGGVPLFVEEVVRSLMREHGDQALLSLAPEAVRPPQLARDLLRERLRRLPEATLKVISSAAVIGESFDLSLLLSALELEPDVLLERLEPALADGQLRVEAPHRYRFAHALYRAVLYEDLPIARRVAIHRSLGRGLLARPPGERDPAEVARHFYHSLPAGDHELVCELSRAAGDAAQRTLSFEAAAVYYDWALQAQAFGGGANIGERAELLLSLATAQRFAGRTRDALDSTSRLLELAQQAHRSELVVRAARLRRLTVAMSMVPDALARSSLEAVLEAVPDGPSAVRVSALSQLAFMPPYSSDLARSKELSARALALASELSDPGPTFEAMRARLFSLSGPDDLEELLQLVARMLDTASNEHSRIYAGDALTARYTALIMAGRIADADEVLRRMTALTLDLPEIWFFWERLATQRRFLDGHFEEADRRWKALHARALRAGVSYADLFYGTHVGSVALEREGAKVVRARMPRSDSALAAMTPHGRAGMVRIAAEAGDHEFARGQLASLGDPNGYARDAHYLHLLANLAASASYLGDRPRCEQLYSLLAPYAELNTPSQMGYYLGSVAHFLGLTAEVLGRDLEAAGHFEHALARNRGMGYRAGVVRTLLAHGALAARKGQKRAARELLERGREEARQLGMRGAQADAERALSDLSG